MSKVENYTRWMENLANNDYYGYLWGGWGPQDYDCGHAIIKALQECGIPVMDHGATYTGNLRQALLETGAKDVTSGVNRVTGAGLKRGDILINAANHAAVYIGNGKLVHARSSEGNTIPGDQNGKEICIQPYFNYPWDYVMRYPGEVGGGPEEGKTGLVVDGICGEKTWAAIAKRMPDFSKLAEIKEGSTGSEVRFLQSMLDYFGAVLEIDGDYGPLTKAEVVEFQKGNL